MATNSTPISVILSSVLSNSSLLNSPNTEQSSSSSPSSTLGPLTAIATNISEGIVSLTTKTFLPILRSGDSNISFYSNVEDSAVSLVEPSPTPFGTSSANTSSSESKEYVFNCKAGLFLPCWHSDGSLSTMIVHGIIYLLALMYMFVGVAIIADRFMAAIEQITSQEQDVVIRKKDGTKEIVSVRIWNETVSNLTLMALGSSAPEIMLSVIEIYAQDFQAGDLGPGTIVGSAAFNMFIIIAVCVWAVPSGTIKKIKYLRVFIVTLTFSVFAYVWMLVILIWNTPGVIDVSEGLVTLLFFGVTVLWAYVADRRLLIYKYLDKHYLQGRKRKNEPNLTNGKVNSHAEDGTDAEKMELKEVLANGEPGAGENGTPNPLSEEIPNTLNRNLRFIDASADDLRTIEDQRDHVIEILKDVKARYPEASADEIEAIARGEIAKLEPKSRAYYRIIAAKRYFGSASDIQQNKTYNSSENVDGVDGKGSTLDDNTLDRYVTVDILFEPIEYTIMEDAGTVQVTLTRVGDIASTIVVEYETESGTAKAGSDFVEKSGVINFGPGEAHKQISIEIINDDEFEDDEYFFVRINDARYLAAAVDTVQRPEIRIVTPKAKVNILDDDHSGIFGFVNNVFQIPETIGEYRLSVNRYCGARGVVHLPYKTIPATAKPGEDFEMTQGELIFHNNETQKEIVLQIINNINYEKNSIFYVELGEPLRTDEKLSTFDRGAPRLGDLTKCMIRIRESKDFKLIVDNLMRRRKMGDRVSSWENQLVEAVKVHKLQSATSMSYDAESPKKVPDKDTAEDEVDQDEPKNCWDYFCHYLTVFWKVIFAIVPPPSIWNGWACFVVSIIFIGILTTFVNDLASHFGATVHLKDSVTAISLVALGTSVPDTFASMISAQNERNADSSIGNVTGSNAVNVFLGIGLAWTVAAVYHFFKGTPGGFRVEPGSLSYSVTLFCICAFVCSVILMLRRWKLGGELGGPLLWKVITVLCFIGLWLFYLTMSTLEVYGVITKF